MSDSAHALRRLGRLPATEIARHDAALVAASGRLFREHGYAGVSIDMIARAASVSPKTIYARYGGKLGLFEAVIEAMVRDPLDVWDALEAGRPVQPVLEAAADRFLSVVLSADVLAMERAILAEALRQPKLAQTFYDRGPRRGLDLLAAYFAQQAERGALTVNDARATAEAFIGLVEGELVRRALFLNAAPSDDERRRWVRQAVALFLKAHARA